MKPSRSIFSLLLLCESLGFLSALIHCPSILAQRKDRRAKLLIDVAIQRLHERWKVFSHRVLAPIGGRFSLCLEEDEVLNASIGAPVNISEIVEFRMTEVIPNGPNVSIFYPLKADLRSRRPYTKFVVVKLVCPKTNPYRSDVWFEGVDVTDMSFAIHEPYVCLNQLKYKMDEFYRTNKIITPIFLTAVSLTIITLFGSLVSTSIMAFFTTKVGRSSSFLGLNRTSQSKLDQPVTNQAIKEPDASIGAEPDVAPKYSQLVLSAQQKPPDQPSVLGSAATEKTGPSKQDSK